MARNVKPRVSDLPSLPARKEIRDLLDAMRGANVDAIYGESVPDRLPRRLSDLRKSAA